MDDAPVALGPDEQRRLDVLSELMAGRLTTIGATLTLELSIRHRRRLKARDRPRGCGERVVDASAESDGRSCPGPGRYACTDYYGRWWRAVGHGATESHALRACGCTIHAQSRAVGSPTRQ